jgi:hypothetical protein
MPKTSSASSLTTLRNANKPLTTQDIAQRVMVAKVAIDKVCLARLRGGRRASATLPIRPGQLLTASGLGTSPPLLRQLHRAEAALQNGADRQERSAIWRVYLAV